MQQRKNVIFIADSLDNAHKFQAVLSSLDVDVAAGSSMQFKKLLADNPSVSYTHLDVYKRQLLIRWKKHRRPIMWWCFLISMYVKLT